MWFKKQEKLKNKKTDSKKDKDINTVLHRIEGLKLSSSELKRWLNDTTTLKFVRLLKIHRKNQIDSLVANPGHNDQNRLILGRCKGYDDVIELIEDLVKNEEDLEIVIEEYLNNLTTKNL